MCWDYNICHEAIDIHDPVRNKNVSGFLPVEQWMTKFIESGFFVDSFRYFNKNGETITPELDYRANANNNENGVLITE